MSVLRYSKTRQTRFKMFKQLLTNTNRGNTLIQQNPTNVPVAVCLHLLVQNELAFIERSGSKHALNFLHREIDFNNN